MTRFQDGADGLLAEIVSCGPFGPTGFARIYSSNSSTPPESASIAEILVEEFVEEFFVPPESASIKENLVQESSGSIPKSRAPQNRVGRDTQFLGPATRPFVGGLGIICVAVILTVDQRLAARWYNCATSSNAWFYPPVPPILAKPASIKEKLGEEVW